MNTRTNMSQDWLQPQAEQQPLQRFIETILERIWLIVAAVAVTTGFAILYVATANKVYEADVQVIVVPVEDPDGSLSAIGLITQSNDPLRGIETAATLIETTAAGGIVVDKLGLNRSPSSILNDITIQPVAESDVLNITAKASTPEQAADLANGFADAAINIRTTNLHDRIDEELPMIEAQIKDLPAGVSRDTLAARASQLTLLRAGPDPNLKVVEPALPPTSASSPKPLQSVIAGGLAGLILGIGAALALQTLDPRLRREDQLRLHFRLPILARVPREGSAGDRQLRRKRHQLHPTDADPLRWDHLSSGAIEAYRTLRAVLTRPAKGSTSKSILVTSPGPSEGKTTSAMSLAASLALAGKSVILIEGDLRRPAIGKSFGMTAEKGVASVLSGDATLAESLVSVPVGGYGLWLLLAEQAGEAAAELLALPAAQDLVAEAKEMAEFVIVDSPPLATVVDALPLAGSADEIVLVVRLGVSRLDRIRELGELLADVGVKPTGFALIGAPRQPRSYYSHPEVVKSRPDGRRTKDLPRGTAGPA